MVHICFGRGKGKTSAAAGMCIRALGNGVPVTIVQFLKDGNSGEMRYLEGDKNVKIFHTKDHFGFWKNMSDTQKEETERQSRELLQSVSKNAGYTEKNDNGAQITGLIVLDEVLTAVGYGIFDSSEIISFIRELPEGVEIVLTGKEAPAELVEAADYITEMRMVKHPFEKGVKARCGVEK